MKTIHTALIAAALTIAAAGSAIAATPDGQIHRPRDPYTDGGRVAVNDIYAGGARIDKRDVFTDGARLGQRDVFTDGSRIGPRDVFTDGARGI